MTNKDWALFYLEKYNWAVIPVDETKKPDKYLPTWLEYQKRLPTKEEVSKWWDKYPNANVAVLCGKISNLTVFDFDIKEDGNVDAEIVSQMPETLSAISPSNGFHLFYTYNPELKSSNNSWGELQNDGKYILIAPSYGKYYKKILQKEVEGNWRWHNKVKPTFLNTKTYISLFGEIKKEIIQNTSILNTLPTSNRNTWFYKEACALFSKNIRKEQVLFLLKQVYENIEDKRDFTWEEASKTILSASKFEKIEYVEEDFETIEADSIIKELQEETPPEMLKTGFKTLDTMTRGGFLPNDFIVLSGASKGGKTTMTKQLLQNCTEYNPTFIAIEDPVKDQMRREKIYGEIGKQGYRIVKKKQKIVTIDWLLELIKISKEKHNSKMFVIDNLDWIKDGTDYKKNIEIITKLKDLCDEINVCIILIVHIKSESEFNFGTRKPDIQKLKGGSHIYQMATKVIMIWRVMIKDGKQDVKDSGATQCILAVDRWSGTMEGKMYMKFNKGKFEEINKDEYLRITGESTPEKKIDITQFKKIDNFKDDL